jgi:hypothetical protein
VVLDNGCHDEQAVALLQHGERRAATSSLGKLASGMAKLEACSRAAAAMPQGAAVAYEASSAFLGHRRAQLLVGKPLLAHARFSAEVPHGIN